MVISIYTVISLLENDDACIAMYMKQIKISIATVVFTILAPKGNSRATTNQLNQEAQKTIQQPANRALRFATSTRGKSN